MSSMHWTTEAITALGTGASAHRSRSQVSAYAAFGCSAVAAVPGFAPLTKRNDLQPMTGNGIRQRLLGLQRSTG